MPERREFIEPLELRPAVELLTAEWGASEFRFVRNFENAVYRLDLPAGPAYLRLTPSSHHSSDEVRSELEFVRYLGGRGISCAQPVPPGDGTMVRQIEAEGTRYTACVFEEAQGAP